tara:strand:+ start:1287 stop:3062 length:1776 start_codon:yes stop_codon:yes gene_type:complete
MAKPGKNKIPQQEIYNYLMTRPGMDDIKARGILANIQAESLFYADAVEIGDMKNKGIGLFQHTFPARKEAFLKAVPDWKTNWKGQIDFALQEAEAQNYKNTNYPTVADSTRAFMLEFEKPFDQSEQAIEGRVDMANDLKIEPEEDKDVLVDAGELPEVTVQEEGPTIDAGELPEVTIKEQELIADGGTLPEVTVEEEGKTFDAGTLPEIKIESKLDLDSIRSLPPQALQVDSTGTLRGPKLSTAQTEENKSAAKTEVVETQYIQVMGPDGQLVTIPVGKNVTKEDIQKSLESQQEGTGKRQEVTQQLQARDTMLDKDNDGIPDTIDVDGGTGTNVPQVKLEPVEESETVEEPEIIQKPQDNAAENVNTDEEGPNIMGVANALLRGTGAILDGLGGPGALISYVMGKKGLDAAMKEVQPQSKPELSPMFMQHLRQTRELAKRGFHPDQEREFRNELDKTYQIGLENAVRGSGGQRARFLAQSGVLDAQRSAALLDYAAKDAELQLANQDKYEKMMLFKENFDIQRSEEQRSEDLARQERDKQAAAKFVGSAFSSIMNSYANMNSGAVINKLGRGTLNLVNQLTTTGLNLNKD